MVPVQTFEKLWFRFGSYFWKVTVPVPVPAPYLDHKKLIFQKKYWNFFLPFYIVGCFTRKKFINFNKFIVKCEWKKFLNEGNQIHNFISCSGSGTGINYGSGSDCLTSHGYGSDSTSQKVTVPEPPLLLNLEFMRIWVLTLTQIRIRNNALGALI